VVTAPHFVKRDAECVARIVIRTERHQQMDEILSALHRAVAEAEKKAHSVK
jgi:hypothetical protein